MLYNLGQVCRALGRNADAVGYFERYLGLGTDEIDADRRAEVFLALDALDPLVGRVRVDIDLDGAHVFVDGIDRGTTPLSRPLLVDPGSHEIEIRDDRLPGGRERREILLAGGLTETIELAAAIVPPPPLPPPPDDDDSVWTSWWLWTIVGAVVAGGAVTAGVLLWPRETAYDAGTVPPIVLGLGSW